MLKNLFVPVAVTLGCVATPSVFAQNIASNASTLEEVVARTVITHPEVQARFQDFQSSLEGQNVARGALLPEVNVQGWVGQEWRGNSGDYSSTNWSRTGYSVQLRQLLFDGFHTINNVKQLGYEKLSGYYELLATVDQLALEAVNAYLDVQRYREMERLAQENYQLHNGTLERLRERSQSGVGRGVDLEQAFGRLALAQTNLMTESNNLNDVTQRYRRITGEFPPPVLTPVPDVSNLLPKDAENFLGSLKANPSLLSKQALVQASQAGVAAAKGLHSPTLEFRASTGKDRDQPDTPYGNAHRSNVQLVLSYNLFRGGADAARVRQTAAQSYAARDVRDYTCRNVQQELAIAWNSIMKLREQLPFLREHEAATSKVRLAYMQQFQIGERTLLDLLDTENELFDSRRALVNAQYDLKKAEYRWLALSNRILQATSTAQPYDRAPDEASALELTDDALAPCLAPVPDTRNLTPIRVNYRDNMQPPTLQPVSTPARGQW